jgi:hypothetical protein
MLKFDLYWCLYWFVERKKIIRWLKSSSNEHARNIDDAVGHSSHTYILVKHIDPVDRPDLHLYSNQGLSGWPAPNKICHAHMENKASRKRKSPLLCHPIMCGHWPHARTVQFRFTFSLSTRGKRLIKRWLAESVSGIVEEKSRLSK